MTVCYTVTMKLKIRKLDWYKRRQPVKKIQPVSVNVDDLQLIDNHRCTMYALYDDGVTYTLSGRVNVNDQTGKWTVHGTNPHGLATLVDIIEE